MLWRQGVCGEGWANCMVVNVVTDQALGISCYNGFILTVTARLYDVMRQLGCQHYRSDHTLCDIANIIKWDRVSEDGCWVVWGFMLLREK